MKTRPIKDLLILVRDYLPGNIAEECGGSICWTSIDMRDRGIIKYHECDLICHYVMENEPENTDGLFFWPYGELEPRIKFLDELIAKL